MDFEVLHVLIAFDCMKLLEDGGGLAWGFSDVLMFLGTFGYGV